MKAKQKKTVGLQEEIPKQQKVREEYLEDDFDTEGGYLEEDFEISEADEMIPQEEEMLEADEIPEDHEEVFSGEAAAGEMDAEAEEYGTEEAPEELASGQLIEPVAGYDESFLELDREDVLDQMDEDRLLDAWYAEFADPAVQALVSQQPELVERFAKEVVIGRDDRIQIKNTRSYPWRAVCSLIITARDGSRWIGTGWLVGYRTVITAGHCVYMHSRGGWVRSIEVIPGRNGTNKPFGSGVSTSFCSVTGWTKKKKRSHDYAAIFLPRSFPIGKRVGYFGYANLGYFSLLRLKVNLSGYPGDKPRGTQWWHCRRIKFVTSRTLVYNIDTAGGQSGAPVWRLKNGKRHVVGIHTNGSSSGNSATRITKPVFKNIKNWKARGMT